MGNFNLASFKKVLQITADSDLEPKIIALTEKMKGATIGQRIGLGMIMERLILQKAPRIDKIELRYFIDILTHTMSYQTKLRTKWMEREMRKRSWFKKPSNLRNEAVKDDAYEMFGKVTKRTKNLYKKWSQDDFKDNPELGKQLKFLQQMTYTSGCKDIVLRELEREFRSDDLVDEQVENDMNNILKDFAQG